MLFVGLFLAAYEIGLAVLSHQGASSNRAGVEVWLRQWLAQSSQLPPFVIPATLMGLMVLWTLWRWNERPGRVALPIIGMIVEGAVFGVALWFLCLNAPMLLEKSGVPMGAAGPSPSTLVTFLGVGIYEEAIFRLIGFALLARIMRTVFIPALGAIPIAILISATAFALMHHLVGSDPFVPAVFLIRTGIGVYCAILFWLRGMGVAVGAHIVYDLVVDFRHG
jgi:hypothetical protein